MKQLTAVILLCITIGCSTIKNAKTNSGALNGTWIPVKQEIAGKELPAVAFATQNSLSATALIRLLLKALIKV